MSDKPPFSAATFLEVKMNTKIKEEPETLSDFDCVYQFEIDDGIWHLDLGSSSADKQIKRGAHDSPDCTIQMTEENFEKLLRKQLNVAWALMSGKIKIKGDRSLALKLGELFS